MRLAVCSVLRCLCSSGVVFELGVMDGEKWSVITSIFQGVDQTGREGGREGRKEGRREEKRGEERGQRREGGRKEERRKAFVFK